MVEHIENTGSDVVNNAVLKFMSQQPPHHKENTEHIEEDNDDVPPTQIPATVVDRPGEVNRDANETVPGTAVNSWLTRLKLLRRVKLGISIYVLWHSTFCAHIVASHWQNCSPSAAVLGSFGSAINHQRSSGDNRVHAANSVDEQQHNLGSKGETVLPISTALASRTISIFRVFRSTSCETMVVVCRLHEVGKCESCLFDWCLYCYVERITQSEFVKLGSHRAPITINQFASQQQRPCLNSKWRTSAAQAENNQYRFPREGALPIRILSEPRNQAYQRRTVRFRTTVPTTESRSIRPLPGPRARDNETAATKPEGAPASGNIRSIPGPRLGGDKTAATKSAGTPGRVRRLTSRGSGTSSAAASGTTAVGPTATAQSTIRGCTIGPYHLASEPPTPRLAEAGAFISTNLAFVIHAWRRKPRQRIIFRWTSRTQISNGLWQMPLKINVEPFQLLMYAMCLEPSRSTRT